MMKQKPPKIPNVRFEPRLLCYAARDSSDQVFPLPTVLCADGECVEYSKRQRIFHRVILGIAQLPRSQNLHSHDRLTCRFHLPQDRNHLLKDRHPCTRYVSTTGW